MASPQRAQQGPSGSGPPLGKARPRQRQAQHASSSEPAPLGGSGQKLAEE